MMLLVTVTGSVFGVWLKFFLDSLLRFSFAVPHFLFDEFSIQLKPKPFLIKASRKLKLNAKRHSYFFAANWQLKMGALFIAALRIGMKNSSQSGRADLIQAEEGWLKATIAGPP